MKRKYKNGGPVDPPVATKRRYTLNSEEYKKAYAEHRVANYDAEKDEYVTSSLPEISISAPAYYDFPGCVGGACNLLARTNNVGEKELRKYGNLYGDAWKILDNAYGQEVKLDPNFENLKVNDLVSLNRKPLKGDKQKGIPSKEQHVGVVSKIENGIPYVKHYIASEKRYYEEPINNISAFTKYTPSRVKRLDPFKEITPAKGEFKFDEGYSPNEVEKAFASSSNKDRAKIQDVLNLTADEYHRLESLAYGIVGAESSFGRSKRAVYRMAVPDFVQKGVKVADDMRRGKNIYDDNINNLSQGYSSTKESSLRNVSSFDGSVDYDEMTGKIKKGDYSGMERTNNFLAYAFNDLGINPDNLDNGANAHKATMATLAWYLKRNPNADNERLLKMYTGKKNVSKYSGKVAEYNRNIDSIPENNLQYSQADEFYGKVSQTANDVYTGLKNFSSNALGAVRDMVPAPTNMKQLAYDMLGGKSTVTQNTLSSDEREVLAALAEKVKGKGYLEYADYGTSENKNDDVGGKSSSTSKFADPAYSLKTLLGQARVEDLGNGKYRITDTYDFNDQGESFGVMDDLSKRGFSAYNLVRALGRNFGSAPNQGADVNILIDANEMKNKKNRNYAYGGEVRRRTNYNTGGPQENPQLFDFLLQQGGVTSPSSDSVAAKTGAGPVNEPSKFDRVGSALSGLSGLASLAGPVGMGVAAVAPIAIPAIMKGIESLSNMNKEPKVISASPGNYATGGDIDLSSNAFQVKGNPGEIDGNSYQTPSGPINLDHNEVVKENFVFSNRLKDPVTGKKFSELARKIETSNAKAEKALRSNPDDTTAMNTLKLNADLSNQIAARQEKLATMKGLRNRPSNNSFALGGPPIPGAKYPPNPFNPFGDGVGGSRLARGMSRLEMDWADLRDEAYYLLNPMERPGVGGTPFAKNMMRLEDDLQNRRQTKAASMKEEATRTVRPMRDKLSGFAVGGTIPPGTGWPNPFTFFASVPEAVSNALKTEPLKNPYMPPGDQWSYQRSSNGRVVKAYMPEGYKMQSTEYEGLYKDPVKGGYVRRNGENGYYYPVNYTPRQASTTVNTSSATVPTTQNVLPFPDASTWMGTPTDQTPFTTTGGPQPVNTGGSGTVRKPAVSPAKAPVVTGDNYGLTVTGQTPYVFDDGKPIPPKPVPEHAVLPLMALPTRGLQEVVPGGAPNALPSSPQYVTTNKPFAERALTQYKETAKTMPKANPKITRPFENRFTAGDAIQAGAVASKFLSLIGGAEQETAQLDNSRITQRYFDVDPLLQMSRSSQTNALNRFGNAPTNVRGAVANQLLATRLNADNQALSQYEQMNQQAISQYEQALANQRRFNVGQINYTNDINARNRGQFDTNLDVAFNSLGAFGIGLNQKQQGTDAMNLMSTMYKDVAARIFSMLQEEELKKKKEESKK